MNSIRATIAALAISLLGCQPAPSEPPLLLPGLAPFLQEDRREVDAWLSSASVREKLAQLLVLQVEGQLQGDMAQVLGNEDFGGLMLKQSRINDFPAWRQARRRVYGLPTPFLALPLGQLANNVFEDGYPLPPWSVLQAVADEELQQRFQISYLQQALGLNLSWLSLPAYRSEGALVLPPLSEAEPQARFVNQLNAYHILPIAAPFADPLLLSQDMSLERDRRLAYHEHLIEAGLGGFWLSQAALGGEMPNFNTARLFRQELRFDGLLIAEADRARQFPNLLAADVDVWVIAPDLREQALGFLEEAYRSGTLSQADLDSKVRRVLLARQWVVCQYCTVPPIVAASEALLFQEKTADQHIDSLLVDYFRAPAWPYWRRLAYESSLVLAANPDQQVPLPVDEGAWSLLVLPNTAFDADFSASVEQYVQVQRLANWTAATQARRLIVVLDDYALSAGEGARLRALRETGASVAVVNLGRPENLQHISRDLAVVQVFGRSTMERELSAQLLFGGIAAKGRLPLTYSPEFLIGQGARTEAVRLSPGLPEQVGIAPERLVGIDAIVRSAISEQAIPGAQVLVAKDGKIVYSKALGHHTYEQAQPVRLDDLYDVASITKVATTSLVAMKQYEAGAFKLQDRLLSHLDLPRKSTLRKLNIRSLLTHQSGLQPHMPVIPYLLARDEANDDCSQFFCQLDSPEFAIPVADSFFFATLYYDKIWQDMQQLRGRRTRYRYSDVNFVLLQRLLETKGGAGLDSLAKSGFYEPLGLRHACFRPLASVGLDRIVPTENDYRWRHQQVHGYVHDETAALLGGVAGHSGLFSNTEELAVLFQMLLNGGEYGGKRLLKAETIDLFTSDRHGNHRGLGFDKPKPEDIKSEKFPEGISEETFGHTGFTGTCAWADPEAGLIYLFLSNRIYPDRSNNKLFQRRVRERIHEVIYDALGTFEPVWPELSLAEQPI